MKTAVQKLAERIDAALRQGQRRFLLEGAELDWVIDAIRALSTDGQAAEQKWQSIETFDGEDWRRRIFWLDWADDCRALNPPMPDECKLFIGRRGGWSSVHKATHWRPMLEGPPAGGQTEGKS